MTKVDAHIHVNGDTEACLALFERLDVKLFDVCVAHTSDDWRAERAIYQPLAKAHPERFAWCTTCDLPDFSGDYAERVIAELEQDFAAGAIACKFWKNIGMEIRKPSGEFLMIDDPTFDPIFDYLARNEIPALMHLGEPLACWQPLDENRPHYGYYAQHPEWHMYTKPDYPSHQQIIDARDRMLARHPKLRVVGAHLGSLEYDVSEIAKRLQRFSNFAVDTSARLNDLAIQDPDTVRQFLTVYAGRVLWGTDTVARDPLSALPEDEQTARLARFESRFQREFTYYETEETLTVANREVRGLGLPADVLDSLYYKSAEAWYPGVL